jgi:hypothetical protein
MVGTIKVDHCVSGTRADKGLQLALFLCCRNVGNVSGILNSLVSKGKVRNDRGTYRL